MNKLAQKIRNFWHDEEGLTMTEYAVVGALITLAAATVFAQLSQAITAVIPTLSLQ